MEREKLQRGRFFFQNMLDMARRERERESERQENNDQKVFDVLSSGEREREMKGKEKGL